MEYIFIPVSSEQNPTELSDGSWKTERTSLVLKFMSHWNIFKFAIVLLYSRNRKMPVQASGS